MSSLHDLVALGDYSLQHGEEEMERLVHLLRLGLDIPAVRHAASDPVAKMIELAPKLTQGVAGRLAVKARVIEKKVDVEEDEDDDDVLMKDVAPVRPETPAREDPLIELEDDEAIKKDPLERAMEDTLEELIELLQGTRMERKDHLYWNDATEWALALSALLHYMPYQYKEVVRALCRADVPPEVFRILGANCPAAVPSLAQGATSDARLELAQLSPVEGVHIRHSEMRKGDAGDSTALSLALLQGDLMAASLQIAAGPVNEKLCLEWLSALSETRYHPVELQCHLKAMDTLLTKSLLPLAAAGRAVPQLSASLELAIEKHKQRKNWCHETLILWIRVAMGSNVSLDDYVWPWWGTEPRVDAYLCRMASLLIHSTEEFTIQPSLTAGVERIARAGWEKAVLAYDLLPIIFSVATLTKDEQKARLEPILKTILFESNLALNILRNNESLPRFVRLVTSLGDNPSVEVPLLMASSLEHQLSRFMKPSMDVIEAESALLVIQCMYALSFREACPASPFAINPRTLPAKELWLICLTNHSFIHSANRQALKEYLAAQVPDARSAFSALPTKGFAPKLSKASYASRLKDLISEVDSDPDGTYAEQLFRDAQYQFPDAVLFPSTMEAMLSKSPVAPLSPSFYQLCCDPLVVCKIPFAVWKRRGLRLVALTMLKSLMITNDAIVDEMDIPKACKLEWVISRNALVIRAVVSTLISEANDTYTVRQVDDGDPLRLLLTKRTLPLTCPNTAMFVRWITVRYPGSIAATLKLKPTEDFMDWVVENIPESIEDHRSLATLLSKKNALNAAERLVLAEFVFRIVLRYGHRFSRDAENLGFLALSQLPAAFFLVVGPVGISVNAIVNANVDATKTARQAAFRMLASIEQVRRWYPRLQKECSLVLQKIASMCRNESVLAGASGAAAARMRIVVKDLLDRTLRAASALSVNV